VAGPDPAEAASRRWFTFGEFDTWRHFERLVFPGDSNFQAESPESKRCAAIDFP
jgi:hypothetical protein